MTRNRRNHEQPDVVSSRGWKYHHIGIPTTHSHPAEQYIKELKMYVRGFDTSPYGIEWMRFEPECRVHDLVRTVPHIAFEVDNLEHALRGSTVLSDITSPSPGVRVAMIVDDGAPVELIECSRPERDKRGQPRRLRPHPARRKKLAKGLERLNDPG